MTAASSRRSSPGASPAPSRRAEARARGCPPTPATWPWATFVVNIVGAFAARLLRDAPAGAPAAVGLPAAAARHRPLRRADDLLDHAGRAAADARRRPGGARRRLRRRERRRRASLAVAAADQPRAPRAGDGMSLLVVLGVGAGRRARRASARFLLDGAVAGRARARLPVRHAGRQHQRRVRARRAGRRCARAATPSASPARAARCVHDVQHVDVREPPARRGRPAAPRAC